MRFACFPDPAEFARRARPLLDADPVRHNVALGILSSLRDHPGRYASFALWAVEDAAGPAAAALHTPPFSAVLVKPRDDAGLIALAEGMHGAGVELPGVGGARPEVDLFAGIWAGLAGTQAVPHMSLRIHALDRVEPVPEAAGAMRFATAADRELLLRWMIAFADEARLADDREQVQKMIDARLAADPPGLVLWERGGEPVSAAGATRSSLEAARVGPVYTPPRHRGKGYATSLVAELTGRLLAAGHRRCMLVTDLANATSNGTYRRIGYLPVCDSADYRFELTALS